eukprot:scaffold9414_cov156-Isochrysis_galbana.AAC.3
MTVHDPCPCRSLECSPGPVPHTSSLPNNSSLPKRILQRRRAAEAVVAVRVRLLAVLVTMGEAVPLQVLVHPLVHRRVAHAESVRQLTHRSVGSLQRCVRRDTPMLWEWLADFGRVTRRDTGQSKVRPVRAEVYCRLVRPRTGWTGHGEAESDPAQAG